MPRIDDARLRELLKSAGLKVTQVRLDVLAVFERLKEPAGVPEIFEAVKAKGVNDVSVYRTVNAFAEAGIIREVNLRHGHADYELAGEDDHHHIVCVSCGKIEEFEDCGVDAVIKKALRASKAFASVNEHALELFGTCKACAA